MENKDKPVAKKQPAAPAKPSKGPVPRGYNAGGFGQNQKLGMRTGGKNR